jgi:hypothetical protein
MAKMTKDAASHLLAPVPEPNVFWCRDGRVFKNLDDLRAGLTRISDETFAFHVTPDKNDFSAWVRTTVGDSKLATDLDKASDPADALKRVEERLAFLRDRLA